MAGKVLPSRHYGSVDVFLEAMIEANPGDVLVIDNSGRPDEGCIGDLTVFEAREAGLAGIVLWGFHRDTAELMRIAFSVFSYGVCPAGPLRMDPREPEALSSARIGDFFVTKDDTVFADEDGAVFVSSHHAEEVVSTALEIGDRERKQAELLRKGVNLREQLHFDEFLRKRTSNPLFSFREHLREIGGAIEE